MYTKYLLSVSLFLLFGTNLIKANDTTKVPIVGFDYVQQVLQQKDNDTTYIINFWATWCKPCVKELPYFDSLQTKYAGKKIKVLLVSLDFKKNYEKMLLPYVAKRNITTPVVLLHAPDANAWIDKVDKRWSGAIPVTIIFKNQRREFYEKEFHAQELYTLVESFL